MGWGHWAISYSAKERFLALCSGVIPSSAQGLYIVPEIKPSCMQDNFWTIPPAPVTDVSTARTTLTCLELPDDKQSLNPFCHSLVVTLRCVHPQRTLVALPEHVKDLCKLFTEFNGPISRHWFPRWASCSLSLPCWKKERRLDTS